MEKTVTKLLNIGNVLQANLQNLCIYRSYLYYNSVHCFEQILSHLLAHVKSSHTVYKRQSYMHYILRLLYVGMKKLQTTIHQVSKTRAEQPEQT